jgi:signal transduction histidine kinase
MAEHATEQTPRSSALLPRRWFALALILSVAMLLVIGWHLYRSFLMVEAVRNVHFAGERLHDDFLESHHQLRACALEAVVMAAPDCEAGYHALRIRFDRVAGEFFALAADVPASLLESAATASERLRELEERTLAHDGSDPERTAHALLTANAYRLSEFELKRTAHVIVTHQREQLHARLLAERRLEVISLGAGFLIFIVSLAVWVELIRRLRRWRQALLQEVSVRREAESELRHAQKVELLGELAGGIAHDFNNLLMAIAGYANLAKGTLPTGHAGLAPLERLEEVAGQARGLTRSLSAFGRRSEPELQPVSLGSWLEGMAATLRRLLPASIDLRVEIPGASEIWVLADPVQLQTLILNLATNARDAMPDGGRLEIALSGRSRPGDVEPKACIRVTDTGHGMSAEARDRLFDPFFTTKGPGKGTGLGLPMVRRILAEHGGEIVLQSAPGEGTTFSVHLPRITPAPGADPIAPAQRLQAGSGERVLLAEDNAYVREIIATTLNAAGYEVEALESGSALMERCHAGLANVALLIIDLDLPGRNGLDCLREIRARGGRTPAIMITGDLDAELEDRLDGSALLLRKPFLMSELLRLVSSLVAERPAAGVARP